MSRHLRLAVYGGRPMLGGAPKLLLLLACLAVAPASPAGERGEEADAPKQCFERLVEGMTRERHKLRSGCFRATGTKTIDAAPNTGVSEERVRKVAQAQIALQAEVQIFAAFDTARDRLRFDWIQPLRLSVSVTGPATIDMLTTRYARRPEYSAHYQNSSSVRTRETIELHLPEVKTGTQHQTARHFDVRSLGLTHPGSLARGEPLERVCKRYLDPPPQVCEDEGTGVFRAEWVYGGQDDRPLWIRRSIWIDTSQGHCPTRLTLEYGTSTTEWTEPYGSVEVAWTEVSKVWVPKALKTVDTNWPRIVRNELLLHWEAINEPLPEGRFHYQDFDVGEKAIVSDLRPFERSVIEDHRNAQMGESGQGQGD